MEMNDSASSRAARLKILLVNFHSTQNAGDLALLEAAIGQLRNTFDDPRLTVSANYPNEPYFSSAGLDVVASPATLVNHSQSGLLQITRLLALWFFAWLGPRLSDLDRSSLMPPSWRTMLAAYKQADLVVGCPGNQFFTMGRVGWPLLVSGTSVKIAHDFGRPFYVMPQSLGPLKRPWERRWMRYLYGKARLIFLRDSLSLGLAEEIGLPGSRLRLAPDVAIAWQPDPKAGNETILISMSDSSAKGKVGVTVIRRMVRSIDPEQIDRYYQALAGALTRLARQFDLEVYFFPQVTGPSSAEDDRQAAAQVAAAMDIQRSRIHLIDELLQPQDLISLYRCMDIFVASRLHSGIFALNAGVPTLFIGYLTKTRGILGDLRLEEWLLDLEQISEDRLAEMIEKLWKQREQVRSEIQEKLPAHAAQTAQVALQISKDFLDGTAGQT